MGDRFILDVMNLSVCGKSRRWNPRGILKYTCDSQDWMKKKSLASLRVMESRQQPEEE